MSVISKLKVWIGSDTGDLDKGLERSKKKVSAFGSGMKKLGGMIAGAFAVSSIVAFAKESLGLSKVQADAEKKLGAVIKATGGAAGLTAEEMKKYASQLQDITTYGDEVTIDAMAIMSTFKSIKGDVFKEAIVAAMDMSTVLKTDLNGSIKQIGKALESPEIGLSALRESGVSFSQEQIKQVKQLVAEGNKQEAQLIMLKELQSEFGGAAKAAAGDAYGAATQLSNAWGDLKEAIGNSITPSVESIGILTRATKEVTDVLNDKSIPTWRKWLGMIIPPLSARNKLEAQGNKLQQQTNEDTIKSLKLSELDLNTLLGKQNVYRKLNEEQKGYFQQTYEAISAEIKKRASGVEAVTAQQKIERAAIAEKLASEEKKKLAIQQVVDLEESSISAIGKKVKAFQELKSVADITDKASLDYYNKEISRLTLLSSKVDELSQKRILDAQKKRDGGVVQKREIYGLPEAAKDVSANIVIAENLSQLPEKLEPLKTTLMEIKAETIDLSNTFNGAFESMSIGFGESVGQLMAGAGDLQGLTQLVAGTFADMAINVGKTAISTGTAVLGIKAALKSLNPYVAIAAGAALVALGSAVKSKLSQAGGGGGTFSSGASGMSNMIDTRTTLQPASELTAQPMQVVVSGQLKAKGGDLVATIESENTRKKYTT